MSANRDEKKGKLYHTTMGAGFVNGVTQDKIGSHDYHTIGVFLVVVECLLTNHSSTTASI